MESDQSQKKELDIPEWLKKLNTREGVLERFDDTKSFLESTLSIKLTNIELVELHNISEAVCAQTYTEELALLSNPIDSLSTMNPLQEISTRFIQEFYGVSIEDIKKLLSEKNGNEILREYFKRKQEAEHKP